MARITAVFMAAMALGVSTAQAGDTFHLSRVRMLVHGGHDLTEDARLELRFVPGGNLAVGVAPVSFLGVKFRAASWLGIEAYAGWAFKPDRPIVSLTLNPHSGALWAWTEVDWHLPSHDGYWFVQADYQIADWFHAGVEGEGWGNFERASSWSHGAGPNALLRFGGAGLDLALHVRDIERKVKPEFFMRVHLFL